MTEITEVEMCEFLKRVALVPRLPPIAYPVIIDMVTKLNFDEYVRYDRSEIRAMFMVGTHQYDIAQASVKTTKAINALLEAGIISSDRSESKLQNRSFRLNRRFNTIHYTAGTTEADDYDYTYYNSYDYVKRFIRNIANIDGLTETDHKLLTNMIGTLEFINYLTCDLEKISSETGIEHGALMEALDRLIKHDVISVKSGEDCDSTIFCMRLNHNIVQ